MAKIPPVDFTIVTFNLYNHADFEQRLPLILDVLRETDADIVCLQELPLEGNFAELLAARLGYPHLAETAFVRPDDGWSEGLAILSRFEALESQPLELRPSLQNCLRARLSSPFGLVDIYVAHLHPRESELRQREASAIIAELESEPTRPAIVCGDFNAVPTGATMAVLWPHLRSAYEMATGRHPLTTFPTPLRPLAGRRPGFSERREAPHLADESEAKAAIDYILVRPAQFHATAAGILGGRSSGGLWPSDHYGVWVTLTPADPS